jgi:hypothetical protein
MKRIILLLLFASFGLTSFAQQYNKSAGLRFGVSSGFEYRVYSDENDSYRFLLSTRDRGAQLHLIREFHQFEMFSFSDELAFIYGVGVHAGFTRWDVPYGSQYSETYSTRTGMVAGMDGVIGVEYNFTEAPISLGIEVKPFFEFLGQNFFYIELFDFAFTVKYRFTAD